MADHSFTGTLSVTDKIGIGIDEPIAQLHIASSKVAPSQAFLEAGGALLKLSVDANGASMGTENAFPLSINTNGFSRIQISRDGNIGVGTQPATDALLAVNGTVKATAFQGDGSRLTGKVNTSGDTVTGSLTVQANFSVSGNVSIGTTSSSHKLAIAAGDINIDDGHALRQAGRWVIGGDSNVLSIGSSNARDSRDIRFDSGFTSALIIKKNTGNVGIGTTSPGAKLDISGGDIRWGNNSRLQTDQGGSIELGGDNSTPGSGIPYIDFHFAGLTQDYNTRIINDANGRLSLVANEVSLAGSLRWGNNSRLQPDQGGSIELGGDNSTPGRGTPYIDFHFAGLTQDYNTRIINDANGRLSLVANEVFVTGRLRENSSRQTKKNINNLTIMEAFKALKDLNPVKFSYKNDRSENLHLGFIAEDVPDLLAAPDKSSIGALDVVTVLTKVVQAQQTTIETLMEKVRFLEEQSQLSQTSRD
jgi:Chaperone of endosialidase